MLAACDIQVLEPVEGVKNEQTNCPAPIPLIKFSN